VDFQSKQILMAVVHCVVCA